MKANPNRAIKIYLPTVRCGEVRLLIGALDALESAYNGFYQWDLLIARADVQTKAENGIHYRASPRGNLDGEENIPDDDRLCLAKVEVIAPAYVEIVGVPRAIERLGSYLAGKRVQWDRDMKEPPEERRLAVEERRIDTVRYDVEMLRGLNYPEKQIREALSRHVFAPLDRLDRFEGLSLHEEEKVDAPQQRAEK
ncbi:MAG TPA: hypothetical protein VNL14_16215 [Candidatus Acidoferrales bacterium]|nr:hypothetical protein [Candidatus Acidoferrales bacterium]